MAEVIFLTHNAGLHEVNLQWHPRAETVLWQPDLQEGKVSSLGGHNVRYKVRLKQSAFKATFGRTILRAASRQNAILSCSLCVLRPK